MAKTLAKHPWLLVSWIPLAALAVVGQKVVPQPWSAGVSPAVLVVALLLFSRVSA
ncbi:hypothetical protein [Streptomyces flaveolus]|uniref:hypothetical protein n=1 Tax=Streptomyces flaveolus TaxID=67297 RepID=UPI003818D1F7